MQQSVHLMKGGHLRLSFHLHCQIEIDSTRHLVFSSSSLWGKQVKSCADREIERLVCYSPSLYHMSCGAPTRCTSMTFCPRNRSRSLVSRFFALKTAPRSSFLEWEREKGELSMNASHIHWTADEMLSSPDANSDRLQVIVADTATNGIMPSDCYVHVCVSMSCICSTLTSQILHSIGGGWFPCTDLSSVSLHPHPLIRKCSCLNERQRWFFIAVNTSTNDIKSVLSCI